MNFTKMHGLGNDYVYVNCLKETVAHPSEMARFVSNRHFGIGSDGLILIGSSKVADFEMVMYNADGSRGEMCGNGIRCVAKYVYDYGLTDQKNITIETLAGIKHLEMEILDGKVAAVTVDMGSPQLRPEQIPVLAEGTAVIQEPILVDGTTYHMTCVSMGNPHAVVYVPDVKMLDLEAIGPGFECHPRFPNRVNTEFCKVIDRQTIEMRVWERGSGETLACGTGACAVAVSGILNGYTEDHVTVKLVGGDLCISWDREADKIYMTGSAVTVYDGEFVE